MESSACTASPALFKVLPSISVNQSNRYLHVTSSSHQFSFQRSKLSCSSNSVTRRSKIHRLSCVPSVSGGSGEDSSESIILNVGGMMCAGCASSVKRILESQPYVSSATVDLAAEIAIVKPVSEAMGVPNHLGETLAKHLTNCGFASNLRGDKAS